MSIFEKYQFGDPKSQILQKSKKWIFIKIRKVEYQKQ